MLSRIVEAACPSALRRRCCASPQPNRSISRLSRAASMSPVTGVRLTQTSRLHVLVVLACPHLDQIRDLGERLGAERHRSARCGIGAIGKQVGTDGTKPLRRDRFGVAPRDLQQVLGLLAADVAAGHAGQTGLGDDLTGLAASTAVEVGHQFAHRAGCRSLTAARGIAARHTSTATSLPA